VSTPCFCRAPPSPILVPQFLKIAGSTQYLGQGDIFFYVNPSGPEKFGHRVLLHS